MSVYATTWKLIVACPLLMTMMSNATAAERSASLKAVAPAAAADQVGKPVKKILFLGNSITLHGPSREVDWMNNWGMAASAPEKDYAHLVVRGLAKTSGSSPDSLIDNIADFERHYDTFDASVKLKKHLEFKPDIVIVAIGENVSPLTSEEAKTRFQASFTRLLTIFRDNGRPAIFVRGCFWTDKTKDIIMQKACLAVGAVFVDISSLGKVDSNHARAERKFAHGGVADHPGDKGMQAIADALLKPMTDRAKGAK